MKMLTNLFSNELIEAAGFAFLHSLWQIALIALCLKCLFIYVHQPKVKYLLGLGALGLVCISVVSTFYLSYPTPMPNTLNKTLIFEQIATEQGEPIYLEEQFKYSFNLNPLKNYFPILFNLWLLGFL